LKTWVCLELRDVGPLGLPSRCAEEIAGRTVLERAVARARRTAGVEGVALLTEPGGGARASELLGSEASAVRVLEVLAPDEERREALRRSRKWARNGWRGGIKQSMELDAAGHFPSLAAAAQELDADALLLAYPEAALVDPELLAGLAGHAAPEGQPPLPWAVCQEPGGLAGLFAMAGWLEPMVASGKSFGELFAWGEKGTHENPVGRPEHWLSPLAVRRCESRLAVDSARGRELVAEILRRAPGEDGLGPDAEQAALLLAGDAALFAGRLPRIVEVELTTDGRVPFADTATSVDPPQRRMTRELFEKILGDLAAYDDVLMTLGGIGDPLAHPEVFDFLGLAREKGIYGLHLDTPGALLDEEVARKLLECDADAVSFRLNAATAETYERLTGRDDFERVAANIERFVELRNGTGRAWPFVIVEAAKRTEVEGELIDFFDRWIEKADWPLIRPFSDVCGRFPDRATVRLTLAERTCCRRLLKEMLILADGAVPVCRMDFEAAEPAGNVAEKSVEELWTAGRIAGLRAEQGGKEFDGFGLCPKCHDWDNV
jgi:hypothetical protein